MRDKFQSARNIKAEKRLESDPPDYPKELPEVRKRIIIIDYDFGYERHLLELRKTRRIDCYKVYSDGKLWKEKIGLSNILAGIRKAMPRVHSI